MDPIKKLILSTRGKFFSIKFIKLNGEERSMLAQVKPTVNPFGPLIHPSTTAISVWDCQKKDWRTIRTDRVTYFKCGRIKYEALKEVS